MHFYFFFSLVILCARIYTIVEKEKRVVLEIYEGSPSADGRGKSSSHLLPLSKMLNPEFDGKTEGEISSFPHLSRDKRE
jgi:hypothetical protein